jgi:hypothetical protein
MRANPRSGAPSSVRVSEQHWLVATVIAIYAALVGTGSLGWQVFQWIAARRLRLTVSASYALMAQPTGAIQSFQSPSSTGATSRFASATSGSTRRTAQVAPCT